MWSYPIGLGLGLVLQEAASPIQEVFSSPTPLPSAQDGGFGSLLWLILGIVIGIVIGLLLSKAFGKSQSQTEENESSQLSIYTPPRPTVAAGSVTPNARRCPKCNSTFTDEALIYCVSDGTALVSVNTPRAYDPKATMPYRNSPK